MLFSTIVSEKQSKQTYYNFQNNEKNPERFIRELNLMSKKLIYFLMYSGVPKEVIPLVLCKASNYNVDTVKRDLYRQLKNNKYCIICGSSKNLTLHHIKPIKDYPELKYRYDNLRPICKKCHKNLHEYEG